jgi:hypothetical protein
MQVIIIKDIGINLITNVNCGVKKTYKKIAIKT